MVAISLHLGLGVFCDDQYSTCAPCAAKSFFPSPPKKANEARTSFPIANSYSIALGLTVRLLSREGMLDVSLRTVELGHSVACGGIFSVLFFIIQSSRLRLNAIE